MAGVWASSRVTAVISLSQLFLRPIIILAFDSKKVGIVGTF